MYTIKQAALRAGVSVALLRAWERRYRVFAPARTASGYRLYDDAAISRARLMRLLVEDGWSPSAAASAVLEAEARGLPAPEPSSARDASGRDRAEAGAIDAAGEPGHGRASGHPVEAERLVAEFVTAAAALDQARVEKVLDEMFARGSFEQVAADSILPALRALGEAWASGSVGVAAEHAASNAVLRRLAAAFQAASRPAQGEPVLVGMPPGGRHELGALAFSVVARRSGLPVLYLGPDLPTAEWVRAATESHAVAAVIGAVRAADVSAAEAVAAALHDAHPRLLIAFGGAAARQLPETGSSGRMRLNSDDLVAAADALAAALARA